MPAEPQAEYIHHRLKADLGAVEGVRNEMSNAASRGPSTQLRDASGGNLVLAELPGHPGNGNGHRHEIATPLHEVSADPVLASRDFYDKYAEGLRALAEHPQWTDDPLAGELLDQVEELGSLMDVDEDLRDEEWEIRGSLDQIKDLVALMSRKIERLALDDPETATSFVVQQLSRLERSNVGRLLGVDKRVVKRANAGEAVSKEIHSERAVLVAQLVYDLRNHMTVGGIVMWFEDGRHQLGGASPLELLDEDPSKAARPLRSLARTERGQLAT